MNSDRIREIQQACAYPESISVLQALNQVWNECAAMESEAYAKGRKDAQDEDLCMIRVERRLLQRSWSYVDLACAREGHAPNIYQAAARSLSDQIRARIHSTPAYGIPPSTDTPQETK